ncbi:cell division protein DamX [Pseudoalteromonas sp. MMG010]|uniref:AAA family ATPase n=1 Tax=Pseudoalteromonas sp. MMG010 TaxID=2822685 RepID=UPI001B3A22A0|nr:AAA family ATPase [Pseudoalteromonas sp. MMG010]MBQ4832632.1 cell division protein DamX [Pseudoalteromonas sp. MMG010]
MQAKILPSRAALVDRIALQFEYGQNLIVLLGSSGLGKSYLLETFITDKYPEFNKAFVNVTAQMTDVQCMASLLEQSFSSPLIDHNLSLADNFYQLSAQQPTTAYLWVIDGAKQLSDEMVIELEALSKNSPTTLYIMVASQAKGQFSQSVEMHLEPLNLKESKQLMQGYFAELPYDEDPIFSTFLAEANGNPGLLLAWQAQEQQIEVVSKDKVSWRVHLITLLLIIMLLMIGVLYQNDMRLWWQEQNEQIEEGDEVKTALDVTTITQPEVSPAVLLPSENSTKDTSNIVTEIEDSESQTAVALAADNDVPAILNSLTVNSVAQESDVPATPDVAVKEVNTPVDITAESEKTWFSIQQDNAVVIQLLAVTQEKVSIQFIANNNLQNQSHVYQTRRNNKLWWIVTYGIYNNIAEAQKGLAQLPVNLQKNKPFFKTISKIKQEIARVDQ